MNVSHTVFQAGGKTSFRVHRTRVGSRDSLTMALLLSDPFQPARDRNYMAFLSAGDDALKIAVRRADSFTVEG